MLDALKAYPGTVCLVTHDRDFASPLVTSVLEIQPSTKANEPSQVVQLLGNYEDYLKLKLSEMELQKEGSANLKAESQSKINKNKSNDRTLNFSEKQQPSKKTNRKTTNAP